jgi:hypothetical protein
VLTHDMISGVRLLVSTELPGGAEAAGLRTLMSGEVSEEARACDFQHRPFVTLKRDLARAALARPGLFLCWLSLRFRVRIWGVMTVSGCLKWPENIN